VELTKIGKALEGIVAPISDSNPVCIKYRGTSLYVTEFEINRAINVSNLRQNFAHFK